MTAWPTERAAIDNMIDHFGDGLFACVMDSYDYAEVIWSVPLCFADAVINTLLLSSHAQQCLLCCAKHAALSG